MNEYIVYHFCAEIKEKRDPSFEESSSLKILDRFSDYIYVEEDLSPEDRIKRAYLLIKNHEKCLMGEEGELVVTSLTRP